VTFFFAQTQKNKPFFLKNGLKNRKNEGNLGENHHRQPHHKRPMFGFMAYREHGQPHRSTPAEDGKQPQGAFGRAVLFAVLGRPLIVHRHRKGDHRYA